MAKRKNRPLLNAAKASGSKLLPFLREEAYAISHMGRPATQQGRARDPVHSIDEIFDEALRLTENGIRHLRAQGLAPKPPVCLQGLDKDELIDWLDEHKARAAARAVGQTYEQHWRGHTVRMTLDAAHLTKVTRVEVVGPYTRLKSQATNVPTLLGAVGSYPGPPDDQDGKYKKWRQLVAAWAKRHYGEDLLSVLEHVDEPHGHIHILVARPDAGPVAGMVATIKARNAAAARGEASNELGQFFRQGGSDLQDEFHAAVGEHLGWVRQAEERFARYGYAESQLRKELAGEVQAAEARLASREKVAMAKEAKAEVRISQMNAMQLAMHRAQEKLAAKEAKVRADQEELDRLRAANAAKAGELDATQLRISAWLLEQIAAKRMSRAEASAMAQGLRQAVFPETGSAKRAR